MAVGVTVRANLRTGRASDAALVSATRAGSEEAFLALYDRYRDLAWRVARSTSRSDVDAEDAVAEGFARVYAAVRSRSIDSFRSYLAATVRHAAIDQHRRRDQPAREVEASAGVAEHLESDALRPADAAEAWSEREMVRRAFESLATRDRLALWLRDVEAFSPAELGHTLGVSANTASAVAMRARERLREAFLREHLRRPLEPLCAQVTERLAAFVRGTGSRRSDRMVEEHLENCGPCAKRHDELRSVASTLAAMMPVTPLGLRSARSMLDRIDTGTLAARSNGDWSALPSRFSGGGWRVLEGVAEISGTPVAVAAAERLASPMAAAMAGLLAAGIAMTGVGRAGVPERPETAIVAPAAPVPTIPVASSRDADLFDGEEADADIEASVAEHPAPPSGDGQVGPGDVVASNPSLPVDAPSGGVDTESPLDDDDLALPDPMPQAPRPPDAPDEESARPLKDLSAEAQGQLGEAAQPVTGGEPPPAPAPTPAGSDPAGPGSTLNGAVGAAPPPVVGVAVLAAGS